MTTDIDFNSLHFEKKLSNLKDSQDSINAACLWCLEHKQFHKKIVATWLSVLQRVKVEQRLTLFYLANDVIQYSKRKNFDFVESWGKALQKATALVRDAKVKTKIVRIFRIWEQRGVYSEEFISDLCGLISVSGKKADDNNEFQSHHLMSKIRTCAKLEGDTDKKLQLFKQHNPKLQDCEALMASLKDRAHVDDVEKEMEEYVTHIQSYIDALRMEIKARNSLINLLNVADAQLEKDRKDVKVVAVAYKSFANRVKTLRRKLEEKKASLSSPVPSPDVNAPSPSPDSDLELLDGPQQYATIATAPVAEQHAQQPLNYQPAGYYNQTPLDSGNAFMQNGFTSFIGSGVTFNFNSGDHKTSMPSLSSLFPSIADPPPPPAPVPAPAPTNPYGDAYNNNQMPLAPPPLPPFTNEGYTEHGYGNSSYGEQMGDPYQNYHNTSYSGAENVGEYNNPSVGGEENYDPYKCELYNPEEETDGWENNWERRRAIETPASPPQVEKKAFLAPIVYHEDQSIPGAVDVDHRLLGLESDKTDIDHRNLISLTGSPKETPQGRRPPPTSAPPPWQPEFPMRYRKDFRPSDNTESIDMDMDFSDEDVKEPKEESKPMKKGLLPPPPFPVDLDANNFLEDTGYDSDNLPMPQLQQQPPPPPSPWHRQHPPPLSPQRTRMQTPLMGGAPLLMSPRMPLLQHQPPQQPLLIRGGHAPRRGNGGGGRGEFNNWGDFRELANKNPAGGGGSGRGWLSGKFGGRGRGGMRGGGGRGYNGFRKFH